MAGSVFESVTGDTFLPIFLSLFDSTSLLEIFSVLSLTQVLFSSYLYCVENAQFVFL